MAYGVIQDGFHAHPRIRVLPRDGKHLFSYLCGNDHAHYSGVYHVAIADIAIEIDMPENDVCLWLRVLEEGPVEFPVDADKRPGGFGYLVEYDWDRAIVWVRGMLKARTKVSALNTKQKTGLSKYLTRFMNCPLLPRFFEYYAHASIPFPKGYGIPHPNGDQIRLPVTPTGSQVYRFTGKSKP